MLRPFLANTSEHQSPAAGPRRALVVVAAPIEAQALLRGLGVPVTQALEAWRLLPVGEHVDLVLSGVGKSNAAGAVARVLDASRHGLVLNIGVAGSLPGPDGMAPLSSIHIASSCIFADEGLETPEGFMDCGQMGFPLVEQLGRAIPTDPSIARTLAPLGKVGPIATVSTCSGTDALARQVVKRTGALVEAMEGAAAALVARRLGVPMAEVRVISNTTGDRKAQRWEMSDALATLAQVIGQMLGTPR